MPLASQYTENVIAGMQMLYGEGFLSPGGMEEMNTLLKGYDLKDACVLDIGCGLGGSAISLVKNFCAKYVIALDVESDLIVRAKQAVKKAGLSTKIDVILVDPGQFDIAAQSIDLILTKDVVCHISDKTTFMSQLFSMLRIGGTYICADFVDASNLLSIDNHGRRHYESYVKSLKSYGLSFNFEAQSAYEDALSLAGFELTKLHDHTPESVDIAKRELANLRGNNITNMQTILGDTFYRKRRTMSKLRYKALESRGCNHLHFHSIRPV